MQLHHLDATAMICSVITNVKKGLEHALKVQAESEVVARWDISMEPIMTMFQEKPEQDFFSSSNT